MLRTLLFIILYTSCSSSPVKNDFVYSGEALSEISPAGLILGHTMLPLDSYPYNQRETSIYFENLETKDIYHYNKTQGVFYMKLPPGKYQVKDIGMDEVCHTSTGLMISNFFVQLPSHLGRWRAVLEKEVRAPLIFEIHSGKMTDIGNLLMTCFEWDKREKFIEDFASYIEDGKFQVFKPMTYSSQECGCKILRKYDGVSQDKMKKALGEVKNRSLPQ